MSIFRDKEPSLLDGLNKKGSLLLASGEAQGGSRISILGPLCMRGFIFNRNDINNSLTIQVTVIKFGSCKANMCMNT